MLSMGDEVRRTQSGNNNAYCQDNEISWFNWDLVEQHADLFRFVKGIIRFNCAHPSLNSDIFISETRKRDGSLKHITWHGVRANRPDWGNSSRSIAFTLHDCPGDVPIHVIFNAYWESLEFELPSPPEGATWRRVVDTALDSPADLPDPGLEPPITAPRYRVASRSAVILVAK